MLFRSVVNDKVVKPSYQIKAGDILEIGFSKSIIKVKVTDISENVKKQAAVSLGLFQVPCILQNGSNIKVVTRGSNH